MIEQESKNGLLNHSFLYDTTVDPGKIIQRLPTKGFMTNILCLSWLSIWTLIYKEMKATGKLNKRTKINKVDLQGKPAYYFHADEDFREDRDWGKSKMIASKAISMRVNKFEI